VINAIKFAIEEIEASDQYFDHTRAVCLNRISMKQKISGGFRCDASAADFAVIRSFISTAKKQGWDIIQVLTQDPKCRLASLRTA
jgi:Ni,Fe-hydrogenase III large subunit